MDDLGGTPILGNLHVDFSNSHGMSPNCGAPVFLNDCLNRQVHSPSVEKLRGQGPEGLQEILDRPLVSCPVAGEVFVKKETGHGGTESYSSPLQDALRG